MTGAKLWKVVCCWLGMALLATAHDEPTSFVDLRLNAIRMEVSVTVSVTDLAHDLPNIEPAMLLTAETIATHKSVIEKVLAEKLGIAMAGKNLPLQLREIIPLPEKRDLRLVFDHAWKAVPENLQVSGVLFPYDPRHRTFLNVYAGERLLRQDILTESNSRVNFRTSGFQSLPGVIAEFTRQGIHHIFIGPDHILFVIGLMLLGGSLVRLLKIITAFTIAHSITLGLATFQILSPPPSVIEPVIALSIVFVGIHALLGTKNHDPRLLFAFCFGLIHGFGFANVLQEMVLPRQALGWSLFAFNVGVEVGQGCIVLAVAPILAYLRKNHRVTAERIVSFGALAITTTGAFWFFQRIIA